MPDPTGGIIAASVLSAGAPIVGGSRQARAAREAGDISANAANRSADLQFQQFQQTRADFEPYRLAGLEALGGDNGLMALLGLNDNQAQTGPAAQPQSQGNARLERQPDGTYRPSVGGVQLAQNLPSATPQSQGGFDAQAYLSGNPDVLREGQRYLSGGDYGHLTAAGYPASIEGYADYHANTFGRGEGRNIPTYGARQTAPPITPAQPANNNALGGTRTDPTQALRNTPGYQFRVSEGLRGVNSSLAARGVLNSGAAQRELMRVGQGMADQTFQGRVNNLMNVANIGSGSAAQISNAGSAYAANAGNALQGGARAQAGAALNRGSAFNNALGGVAGAAGWGLRQHGAHQGWEGF